MPVIVCYGRDHGRLAGLTGFNRHCYRIGYRRRIARGGRCFLYIVRARGDVRNLAARNGRTVIRNREGHRDIRAVLLQGCRALCVSVYGKRVVTCELALRDIGADTRPVLSHEFLNLERAVGGRIGDGVDVAGLRSLGNGYRSAVVRSGGCVNIVVIDLCFDDAVLNSHILTLVAHRKYVRHLERETVERPLPIVVFVQHQNLTLSIHPSVSTV